MPHKTLLLLLFTYTLSLPFDLVAEEYQSSADFINTAFNNIPPKPKSLWISKEIKAPVTKILQHKPGFMRTRYWQDGDKTAWILNEIGKTKLITVGIIIENKRISLLKVLAFRESRGWEVKHDFFTNQFKQVALTEDNALDASIDGISGATLSVRALSKTAQLALFFNQHIQQ
jgi:uncharacterized protein with FMN-binding domain